MTQNSSENEDYIVEKIVDIREYGKKGIEVYLKWEGYDDDQNTWEPLGNLNDGIGLEMFRELKEKVRWNKQENGDKQKRLSMSQVQMKLKILKKAIGIRKIVLQDQRQHFEDSDESSYRCEDTEIIQDGLKNMRKGFGSRVPSKQKVKISSETDSSIFNAANKDNISDAITISDTTPRGSKSPVKSCLKSPIKKPTQIQDFLGEVLVQKKNVRITDENETLEFDYKEPAMHIEKLLLEQRQAEVYQNPTQQPQLNNKNQLHRSRSVSPIKQNQQQTLKFQETDKIHRNIIQTTPPKHEKNLEIQKFAHVGLETSPAKLYDTESSDEYKLKRKTDAKPQIGSVVESSGRSTAPPDVLRRDNTITNFTKIQVPHTTQKNFQEEKSKLDTSLVARFSDKGQIQAQFFSGKKVESESVTSRPSTTTPLKVREAQSEQQSTEKHLTMDQKQTSDKINWQNSLAKPTQGDLKDLSRGMPKRDKEFKKARKARLAEKYGNSKDSDIVKTQKNLPEGAPKKMDVQAISKPSLLEAKLFANVKRIYSDEPTQVLDNESFAKTEKFKLMNRIHSDLCNDFEIEKDSWEVQNGKGVQSNGRWFSNGAEKDSLDITISDRLAKPFLTEDKSSQERLRSKERKNPRSKSSDFKILVRLTNKKLKSALKAGPMNKSQLASTKCLDLQDYFPYDPQGAFEIQQEIIKKMHKMLVECHKDIQAEKHIYERLYKQTFFMEYKKQCQICQENYPKTSHFQNQLPSIKLGSLNYKNEEQITERQGIIVHSTNAKIVSSRNSMDSFMAYKSRHFCVKRKETFQINLKIIFYS